MKNPFALSGKHVLITGASSGIGRSTAIMCAGMGARVTITGRNEKRLNETLSVLEGSGHNVATLDMNDAETVSDFIENIDKLNGIVYCAGTQKTVIAKNIHREDLNEVMETNFFSTVNLNTNILEKKKLLKGASVVFISSTASYLVAETGNAIYSASKGAISAFARVLALELSLRKIRVNCVLPGMVKTPLQKKILIDEEEFMKDEKKYPFGYGKPEDVANAVVYLLSDASRWVTGTSMLLDGGLTLR